MNHYTFVGIASAILFALLPFVTSRHLFHGAVNSKYFLVVAGILLMGTIAAWALWTGRQSVRIPNRPLLWVLLGGLVLYWLSALLGIFPERSLFSDIQRSVGIIFLTHVAVFAWLLSEFLTERDWTLLRRTVVVSAGIFSFFAILGGEGIGIEARLLWTNLAIHGYTFGNSTFAGVYLFLALFVGLWQLQRETWGSRWFYGLSLGGILMFFSPIVFNIGIFLGRVPLSELAANPILLLGTARASSAAAVLLVIFFGGYLLLRRYAGNYRYAIPTWSALLGILIIVSTTLLFMPGSFIQEKYIEASTGARVLVWEGGLKAFWEKPLLGWGPENFEQAHQGYADPRLYTDEFIGEIWFDRAHNVMVDTLVNYGIIGLLANLALAGAFLYIIYRAQKKGLLSEPEAVLLFAFPFGHFLQLQTGFDTVGSYAVLAIIGGYALSLERAMAGERIKLQSAYYKTGAVVLAIFIALSAKYALIDEFNRQLSLYSIFVETDRQKQLELAEVATSRLSSFESLRFASGSLIKGMLEGIARREATPQTIQRALPQLEVYEKQYLRYLEAQPNHYRARMNLAYLYSVQTVLGNNKLAEAKEVIAQADALSPENPLTRGMEALLLLYSGNLNVAEAKAQEAIERSPNADFGKQVLAHIKKQRATFPTITVLRLENL